MLNDTQMSTIKKVFSWFVNFFPAGFNLFMKNCLSVSFSSGRGAKNCSQRKPCTLQDYYDIRTACDDQGKV